MDINKVKDIVEKVLVDDEKSRGSDARLYSNICKLINIQATSRPFYEVVENPAKYGFPNYETVRRTRQKIQEEREELRPSKIVQDGRKEAEQMYLDFVRG